MLTHNGNQALLPQKLNRVTVKVVFCFQLLLLQISIHIVAS